MAEFSGWLSEQRRIYCDNAGLAKEFRTQLRGIKSPLLLSAYLGLFVFIATLFYWGISISSSGSLSATQEQLQIFYRVIVGMLEFMVALIASVLAASSINGEYSRQSIDLLFSSPVGPKYFLVGKLMASYRYVLLLLVMTMPVSAMCVVLGGATWQEVLATYAIVSFHALIYMSISIPVAVLCAKAVPAIMWSYLASFCYFLLTTIFASMFMVGSISGQSVSPPLYVGLSPAFSVLGGSGVTEIFGQKVPLWIPTGLISLLFARIMLLGAATSMTQAGSKESCNLRITGIILAFLLPLVIGLSTGGSGRTSFGAPGTELGSMVLWFVLPLIICLPYLSTWSAVANSKVFPNGFWKLSLALRGTPASGLPYLVTFTVSVILGSVFGNLTPSFLHPLGIFYLIGDFALILLAWGLGWLASGFVARGGADAARRLQILFVFLLFIVPLIGLGLLETALRAQGYALPTDWSNKLYLFNFVTNDFNMAWYKILIIGLLSIAIFLVAERRRRKILQNLQGG